VIDGIERTLHRVNVDVIKHVIYVDIDGSNDHAARS
jgi:hypothetical protein